MSDERLSTATNRGPSNDLAELGLVATGGALGAVSRALVGATVTAASGPGWAATQLVNLSGAFALGLLTASLERRGPRPRLRAFLAVGFLGAFTTFSALVGEVRAMAGATTPGLALAMDALALTGSLALGLGCFWLGHRAVERVGLRPRAAGPSQPGSPPAETP
jgi:CrcB protein